VLVLERWSLFSADVAPRRTVRGVLDTARRSNLDAQGLAEFDYQWISLSDCTRGSAPLTREEISSARSVLSPDKYPDRAFLIDKVDSRNAVITRELADRAFSAVAVALMTSSAAFPTTEVDQSSVFGVEAPERAILPIALMNIMFSQHDVRKVFESREHRRILRGSSPVASRQPNVEIISLEKLAELEKREMEADTYVRTHAHERRAVAAADLLRVAFASGSRADIQLDRIGAARQASRRAFVRRNDASGTVEAGVNPQPRHSGLFAWLRQIMSVLLGAVGLTKNYSLEKPERPPSSIELVHETATEWESLCSNLEIIIASWKSEQTRTLSRKAAVWQQHDNDPYAWYLTSDPSSSTAIDELSDAELNEFARAIVDLLDNGVAAADVVQREIGNRATIKLRSVEDVESLIAATLREPASTPLTASLGRLPLMASALKCDCSEVLWIFDPAAVAQNQVFGLEPAANKNLLRSMTHDDRTRITRLAFGNTIDWKDVISLRILECN
jgi:hypothetical protein